MQMHNHPCKRQVVNSIPLWRYIPLLWTYRVAILRYVGVERLSLIAWVEQPHRRLGDTRYYKCLRVITESTSAAPFSAAPATRRLAVSRATLLYFRSGNEAIPLSFPYAIPRLLNAPALPTQHKREINTWRSIGGILVD